MSNWDTNFYWYLGVSKDSSLLEIKKAYKRIQSDMANSSEDKAQYEMLSFMVDVSFLA